MINLLEETVWNHNIVLLWRINKIASWLTLKSSEVKNFLSWWISRILKYFLVSSASCQACFPLAIWPMRGVHEIFLKIFFYSPELNGSIIFSMHMLSMTKKMNHFLRDYKVGEWVFPWFNIGPSSFLNRNCFWRRAGKFSSLWFCFCLWSACKIFRIQF